MTRKYNKNLMTSKAISPLIKEKNPAGKRQALQYKIVSNYLNSLRF